jgi:hypothetical protein
MVKKKVSDFIVRTMMTMLGAAFILWAISTASLGFIGEEATAVITDIRREGGERTDGISGRYTYNISYTFSVPDGRSIYGFSKYIGDSVYIKATRKSTTTVRYFSLFPHINALDKEVGLKPGQMILIAVGGFLIVVMNKKK